MKSLLERIHSRTARVGGNVLYVEALHEGTWALGPNGGPWHFVP